MNIYDFSVNTIDGKEKNLSDYKGKVLLVVNTASKCGFTPQYEGLQKLYEKFSDRGFEVLGFPCNQFAEQDPAENSEIEQFCKLKYGVTFPMFEKINVKGEDAHPLFKYLSEAAPFKGIDENIAAGKVLSIFLKGNLPQSLEGNSIKWNFTKFLIDKNGNIINRFESPVEPSNIATFIEQLL